MRAYVKRDLKKAELIELPAPEPRPGEIVVRTTLASICGTDLHLLDEYPNELIEGVYPGVAPSCSAPRATTSACPTPS